MNTQINEQGLTRLCSEHNRWAEDELYRRYAARIYALCLRYTDDEDDAKDLMQETFIKAFGNITSFSYRGEGSLSAWLSRIAVNLAVNELKRHKIRFLNLDVLRHDIADEPPEEMVARISEETLLKMISELRPMRRIVFNMFCIDGYSHKEIAIALSITEKGSASILSKAKAQLKEKITHYIKQTERR